MDWAVERFFKLFAAVIAASAVTLTALNIHATFWPHPEILQPAMDSVAGWERVADDGARVGPMGAPVTVVVFSDYSCPVCRTLALRLEGFRRRHLQQVAVVWRQYPLTLKGKSRVAAELGVCADVAGVFEAAHPLLFRLVDSLDALGPQALLTRLDLGGAAGVHACLQAGAHRRVDQDIAAGNAIGVVGTPTMLINGALFVGVPDRLEHVLSSRMREKR